MSKTSTPKKPARTSSRVTHQPPFVLTAMIRTVAGENPAAAVRELTIADAFAARLLRNNSDPKGLGGEDAWGGLVSVLAPRYGSREGLAKVLKWAGQENDDDLVLYRLLNPYVDAAFLLGLSLGHRLTVRDRSSGRPMATWTRSGLDSVRSPQCGARW